MDAIKRFFGGMLMEQKGDAGDWHGAMGRVAFWLIFLHLLYFWQTGHAIDDTEKTVFEWILGYNGFKVGMSTGHKAVETVWGGDAAPASPEPAKAAA